MMGLEEVTLLETNIAPKNGWLEYYFPIGEAAMLVSGGLHLSFLGVQSEGCRFGPESSRQTLVNHQYLDPAWYHLWRIVSEDV